MILMKRKVIYIFKRKPIYIFKFNNLYLIYTEFSDVAYVLNLNIIIISDIEQWVHDMHGIDSHKILSQQRLIGSNASEYCEEYHEAHLLCLLI